MHEIYTDKHIHKCPLPLLKPLCTFLSVAKTKNFAKTSEDMHITPSAVSSQIKKLEEYLDVVLFERLPNRLVITEAGERYIDPVKQVLEILNSATNDVIRHQKGVPLKLQVSETFASWLKPRLYQFNSLHPGVHILFQQLENTLFLEESVDMAILHQDCAMPQVNLNQLAMHSFKLRLKVEHHHDISHWHMIYLKNQLHTPVIEAFKDWLLKEINSPAQQV